VVANAATGLSVLLNAGGTVPVASLYATSPSTESYLAVADFNGDGQLDVAVTNNGTQTGTKVDVLLNKGGGILGAAAHYLVGMSPNSVTAGDLNGDGKIDLAVPNTSDSTMSTLLGNGDGTFQNQQVAPTGPGIQAPRQVLLADFDGDGLLDAAAINKTADNVGFLHGNGNGTLKLLGNPPSGGSNPRGGALADFNGDGWLDVAVANYMSGNVGILAGHGDGTFQPAVSAAAASFVGAVAAGDVNGDGRPDLVLVSF
jgi:hypothetical protein